MSERPTIAITGATGLVGGALCRHLAAAGYRVVALVRREDAALGSLAGVECRACALPDGVTEESLVGVSVLIHAAYPTRLRKLGEIRRINEEGTRRLLDVSRRIGVEQFVLVSTTSAHEGAVSYYGRSKLMLEGWLDPSRDLVIRPGLVLAREGGLFCRIRDTVRRSRFIPVFGGGRQVIQTVHVQDLCLGFERAIERREVGRLTLAEPDGMGFRAFLRLVAERLGRRVTLVPAPIGLVLGMMQVVEALRLPLPVSSENLLGLRSLRHVECRGDLERLGLNVRTAAESLRDLIG